MRAIKYVPRKHIDNRHIQRQRSALSSKRFTVVFLLGCSLVLGMIFSGWVRWKQTEIVYRINQSKAEKESLVEKQKQLKSELSRLLSLDRAARIAREQLGMEQLDAERIFLIGGGEEQQVPVRELAAEPSTEDIENGEFQ